MGEFVGWFEALFGALPAPLLEVWGRLSYVVGSALAVCAFGGFTFRLGTRWGFGRERQSWDAKAVLSMPLTFVLVTLSGYVGSFIVLVPGAQTFESLKDLAVFLCILCFGYPALLTVPFAYGVSDLVEGVPPAFLLSWALGYFINPACFWLAHQLLGKDPNFLRARTWGAYGLFVLAFMATEPILWGYICADEFTAEISYHNITPALFFTTLVTWILAPFATLVALPLTRRLGLFWAEIPGHVRERPLGGSFVWEAGGTAGARVPLTNHRGLPIRLFILGPFVGLVLVLVGATAYVTLRSAEADATKLANHLQAEVSENINLRLDDYLALERVRKALPREVSTDLERLLAALPIAERGRAFILDGDGELVATSANDRVVELARASLRAHWPRAGKLHEGLEYHFEHVTARPLSHETWLAYAMPYEDRAGDHADWVVVTALPEAYYLAGIRTANSRSALVFAVAFLIALGVAAALASNVTGILRRTARTTRALALGDLDARVPASNLAELDSLASSFNEMAEKLQHTFVELRREVDARKLTEQELRESEARVKSSGVHLEKLVKDRTLELERARDDADRANRAKSAFLANVSHEIRTPMNAILGFGQLLDRDPDLSPPNRERLRKILASGYHLLDLINNVLALSKIEAGRMDLAVTSFDLHETLLGLEAIIRPSIGVGVTFALEGLGEVPRYVRADAGKLRQILLNLLGNAAKFTQAGSVRLRVAVVPESRSLVTFEVIDTGVGIARAELPRVFEPFEQASSARLAPTGTGLGAAISRDFAELMGGDLRVASELGRGTTFTLTLPLERTEAVDVVPAEKQGVVLGVEREEPLRLLVVDDESDNRALLREILASAGVQIAEAEGGADAVESFLRWRPDLILMDVKMPGVDGVEATRRIRATPSGTNVPIVMLSASVFEEDREQVLATGGNEFIAKPFRESEIWDAIERQLGLTLTRAPLSTASPRRLVVPSRADVLRLGPELLLALRQAVELGYLNRVPGIVAAVPTEHQRTAADLARLAQELEIETLVRLFAEEALTEPARDA
jgi:signal transduction histidine kinase/CheY-like chemotaxis protein